MSTLPKAIHRFSVIPMKIPIVFFTDMGKNHHKIHKKTQKTQRIAKAILRKRLKLEESHFLDFKIYYKATEPKTVWN